MAEISSKRSKRSQRGQSLVEVAISMPILLMIIVGLVEVSQMGITQNRVSTAARNAARFGAQGGEDLGIRHIALNTVTQTLDLTDGMWDIFVVRGELNQDGDLPAANFSTQQIYGAGMTQAFTTTTTAAAWTALREEIVDKLAFPGTDPAGLKFVGVLILHDIDSILGLDLIPALTGRNTIRGFSIMRNSALATTVTQSAGCTGAYPLIVDIGTRSVTKDVFDSLDFHNWPFPNPPSYNSYSGHQPDVELTAAREGYIFKLDVGTGPQNVGLLHWNPAQPGDGNTLPNSLNYPGNSTHDLHGFREWGDQTDREMHVGDRVAGYDGGTSGNVLGALTDHITQGRALRLPLWDQAAGGYVAGDDYFFISGFGIFRVRGYGAGGSWILLEFIRIDESCGRS